jgi:diguanylate cyclase (GGDEF)-like protein/PAS domain S-box-containing protein
MSRTKTPVIDRMIVGLIVLGGAISLLNLVFQARSVVILLILMGIVVPLSMALAALRAYWKGFKPARLFMIAWSVFIAGVVLFALTNGGVISFSAVGFHGFQIGSALTAILLSFSLGDRIRTLRRERDSFKKNMELVTALANSIESGVFLVDRDTLVIEQANLAAEKLVGRPRREIVGHRCRRYFSSAGSDTGRVSDACLKNESHEDQLITTGGRRIPVLKSAKLIELDGHDLIIESFVDISDLKRAEEEVRRSEAKFRSLFESSRDAIIILDDYRFVECNAAALEMFGCTSATEMIDRLPADYSPTHQPSGAESKTETVRHMESALATGSHLFEWLHKRANGELFPTEVMLSAVDLEGRTLLQAMVRDVSQRKSLEAELKRLASIDPLTGANNRRSFLKKGNDELVRAKRYHHDFAFLMLDVDHFKLVNDTYGHRSGDMVLKQLVTQIIHRLRRTDLFGRLGGEEFAIVLPETDAESAVAVGESLRKAIAGIAVASPKGLIRFTVSIGMSMFEEGDGEDEADALEKLMERADAALYVAKKSGRNRIVWQ